MEAVRRHEHDTSADDVERVTGLDGPALDQQPSPLGLEVAGEDVEQRLLALALEGNEPEHLAGRDGERDVLQLAPRTDMLRFEGRTITGRHRRGPGAHLVTDDVRGLAEHRRHDLRLASLTGDERRHVATIA